MDLNRRQFLGTAAVLCTGACGMSCSSTEEPAATPRGALTGPVEIGTAGDYPRDGVYDRLAASQLVLVVRDGGRIYATSAVCTHRHAILTLHGGTLLCPKHGSRFDRAGVPMDGPARRPLPRHAISARADGTLVVNRSIAFAPSEWDQPGAYVTI